jgi:hypothetical protein
VVLVSLAIMALLAASADAQTIAEFPPPTGFTDPLGITAGPDGALWFTEGISNQIGRITTAGAITQFPVPTANSDPRAITAGPDGALWFTEFGPSRIGRITTAGVITEFPLPTPLSRPLGITAGPDGALWFTEYGADRIGRITTAGAITEFATPTPVSRPVGITTGPDGALWFTEADGNKIGQLQQPQPPLPPNDDFANATAVTTLRAQQTVSNTVGATTEPGEQTSLFCAGLGTPLGRTVWYAFTPSVSGLVAIDTSGSNFDTVLAVYTGSSLPTLNLVACNDNTASGPTGLQSRVTFQATAGTTYRVQVGGYNSAFGSLVVSFARAAPPPPCSPRPSVSVSVIAGGAGRLQVTLSANVSDGTLANALQSLAFGSATGALIDIPGGQTGASGNFTVTLPAGTQQTTFFVRQATPGQAATVPLTVTDACGAWPTIVGGGPQAFPPGSSSSPSAPAPAPTASSAAASPPAGAPSGSSASTPPPAAIACSPRPPAQVSTAPSGPGQLQVTVAATGAGNSLQALRFGTATNARIQAGAQSGNSTFTVSLAPGTQQTTFALTRLTVGQPLTVNLVAVDACGDWPTVVGAGAASP